jgi:hypothetical protein
LIGIPEKDRFLDRGNALRRPRDFHEQIFALRLAKNRLRRGNGSGGVGRK